MLQRPGVLDCIQNNPTGQPDGDKPIRNFPDTPIENRREATDENDDCIRDRQLFKTPLFAGGSVQSNQKLVN